MNSLSINSLNCGYGSNGDDDNDVCLNVDDDNDED